MRKLFILALLAFPTSIVRSADFSSSGKGTTTAQFLKIGAGARATALGEAFCAVGGDANALYWNPAAMQTIENRSATFMHAAYFESSYLDYASYAHRVDERIVLAAGLQYFSAGQIQKLDEYGVDSGHFAPNDTALTVGMSYRYPLLTIGASGKWIRSKIVDSASTGAMDFGILSHPIWKDHLRLGASISNLGGQLKFGNTGENLPVLTRIGGALQLTDDWLLSVDGISPRDNQPWIAIGTEYQIHATPNLSLLSRVGYNSRTSGDIDGTSGCSFGFGINFKKFFFDYAFIPFGDIGMTNLVSITLNF